MEFDSARFKIIDHPLVQHKIALLRDESTSCKQFKELVGELAMCATYEATRDLPLEDVEVTTPLETTTCKRIPSGQVAVVPILRAGLGMVDGILDIMPNAHVGHLGMQRDPDTHEPIEYYSKFPSDIAQRVCLLVDPMLATGGSLTDAIGALRKAGVKDIRCLTLVSAPEGVKTVLEYDPDVTLYTCALDRQLNEIAYILPGLGDAGDRIFGTV